MSNEKVTQIVKAFTQEKDGNDYRVVGMTSESGFFAFVESRPAGDINAKWEQYEYANQYQVWESDTPDFMNARDLRSDSHLREWFEGQGFTLDTELLTNCCGGDYIWLDCDECRENDEPHSYATCGDCGADIDD